ncbi:unnamed protein product [Parnassius apollo]|uniref:(apollo) hypothetical protein n=1 Tax=Parnassius apollo TaxID=110799 RepID=A0A8S3WQV7_PARAO|nr:unnamed protein product [Parnassius apollo]
MVEERDKENISPSLLTQPDTRQEFEPIIQKERDSSNETHAALSVDDKSIPSTYKQQQASTPNYYISPIQSDQSDFDNSDEDPNFQLNNKSKTLSKIVPFGSLLSSSSINSCNSKSSSRSNSLSDTEDDSAHLQLDPQNTTVAEINSQDLVIREKRIESHYLRAKTKRQYISSKKSLADIYRHYKQLREKDGLAIATSSTFNRIFNTEFNISFFVPKKDQCILCERHKNSDSEEKRNLSQEYEQHQNEKVLARTEKDNDKSRADGTIVAVYDLKAVLQIPKGQISLFFYKSRINCLNFSISDLRTKES